MPEGIKELLGYLKTLTIQEYYEAFSIMEEWLWGQEQCLQPKDQHREEISQLCVWLTESLEEYPDWMKIHILSFCTKCSGEIKYVKQMAKTLLEASFDDIGEYSKYYLYWQVSSVLFQNTKLQNPEIEKDMVCIYKQLHQAFYQALHVEKYRYLPIEERNQEKIFLFTSQLLGELHAPTKTVCDRAYYLQKYLNKKVVIINTAMSFPKKGDAPFYNRERGGYNPDYLTLDKLKFKDEIFDFYQCENIMPDVAMMQKLLERVAKEKPYCIVSVGGDDICADLCGAIVPHIVISTVFSGISTSCAKFQIVGSDVKQHEYELLEILGTNPKNVKKTLFTFVFKEQDRVYTREQLGLRKDAMIVLVTGWRLAYEVDEEFLQMLENLVADIDCIDVVFMGLFENYQQRISKYPKLQERAYYREKEEDALAVTECCDLYVNPKRKGGGSSAAEALYKGIPVVTMPFGDVSAAAGEDFWVDSYEEMYEKTRLYCNNRNYYKQMAELGRKRAEALMDSRTSFCETFLEIEKMKDFQ